MRARVSILVLVIAMGFCVGLWWLPVASTKTRALFVACLATAWTATVALTWLRPRLRWSLIGVPFLLIAAALLTPQTTPAERLREQYLTELRRYDGTPYVWGGENGRGIDCSGLVRSSLVTASVKTGRMRQALELWWFDASARALGEGYRGWTHEVTAATSFSALDATLLQPGDLAVTQDGLHVLAFLGDLTWIQADPTPMRTHIDTLGTAPPGGWFVVPIRVVRWRALEP